MSTDTSGLISCRGSCPVGVAWSNASSPGDTAPCSGDRSQVGFVPLQGGQHVDGPFPAACFVPSALALLQGRSISNCNGNISECSIERAAGGDAGQTGQQPVSSVKPREGNPSRGLTARMAQMGLQTSQEASTRPQEVQQHPASRQPGPHHSLQPPALHKSLSKRQ